MVLLILDNHASHISLPAIDKCKELGIILLTIPPKTSHRLQPLDVSIFSPFKTAYNSAMDAWIRSHPGKRVTIYDIPQLVCQTQINAMIPRNVLSGFQTTGTWPYNPDIFTELDFAPASVTDRDFVSTENENGLPEEMICDPANITCPEASLTVSMLPSQVTDISKDVASISVVSSVSNISSPITVNAETNTASSGIDSPTTALYVSPNDIVTFPKAMPRKKKSKPARRKGKTEIYTLTPVRNAVAEREQTQIQRKNSKKSSLKKKVKKFTAKKQLFKKKPRKQQQIIETSDEDSGSNIQYADESDISFSDEEITANIGKFVIVKVSMYLALHKVACTLSQIFCMSRLNVKIVSLKFK